VDGSLCGASCLAANAGDAMDLAPLPDGASGMDGGEPRLFLVSGTGDAHAAAAASATREPTLDGTHAPALGNTRFPTSDGGAVTTPQQSLRRASGLLRTAPSLAAMGSSAASMVTKGGRRISVKVSGAALGLPAGEERTTSFAEAASAGPGVAAVAGGSQSVGPGAAVSPGLEAPSVAASVASAGDEVIEVVEGSVFCVLRPNGRFVR